MRRRIVSRVKASPQGGRGAKNADSTALAKAVEKVWNDM